MMQLRLIRKTMKINKRLVCGMVMGSGLLMADDRAVDLAPYAVIGTAENLHYTPGSGYVVEARELAVHGYDNIEQALRRVPGVYFRTEDGYGLFPNISLRGVGSMRTTKLTVMEDGVLAAPAPYAAPAAYYTPTTGRMAGLEVLKGSSQIEYGPQTTGGVLNYLATALPQETGGQVKFGIGAHGERRAHLWHGHVVPMAGGGTISLLAEVYARETDGFKRLDGDSGASTGFRKVEPLIRLGWRSGGPRQHSVEFKLGYSQLDADETYLGLSTDDFRADPTRRYVASRFDRIETENVRFSVRHAIELGPDLRLATTVYGHDFSRSWYKLQDVRQAGGRSSGLSEALAGGPFVNSAGQPVAGTEGEPLAVLRGEAAGIWRVRDNARDYAARGIDSRLNYQLATSAVSHFMEFGVRLHEDYEDRRQKQDDYTVGLGGVVSGLVERAPGTQDNRRGTAQALAVYARDRMTIGSLTVTPGVRYERIEYTNDRRGMDPALPTFDQVIATRRATLEVWAPGISVLYETRGGTTLFGGVHRGFALPGPGAATSATMPLGAERSVAWEAGMRQRGAGGWRTELVVFLTDFSDLIVPESIGGAGSGVSENAGDVRTAGIELAGAWDLGAWLGWQARVPLQAAITLTEATIRNAALAGGSSGEAVESVFAGAQPGNPLPYVPDYQISLGVGWEYGAFSLHADVFYVPGTYAAATANAAEINPVGGAGGVPRADARFGRNDPVFLLDLSLRYTVAANVTLSIGVQNALDRQYIASRLPHGPRPGHPRQWSAAVSWTY
jgi:Fe(3+) dicitrate transport protein